MYQQLRSEVLENEKVTSGSNFDIDRYPFMEGCISEAERLHPVFEGLVDASVAVNDFELLGRKMPKGTLVVGMKKLAMWRAMENDGFSNLEAYDPERFLETENQKLKMNRGLWKKYDLGFGGGPRECPGQQLFKYETMLLLRELALRFPRMEFDKAACGMHGELIGETWVGALRPSVLKLSFSS